MLLPKNVFPISKLADKDGGPCYTMNAVCLRRDQKGNPKAIVTDGHCLLEVSWKETSAEAFPDVGLEWQPNPECDLIIPAASWEEAGRNIKKSIIPVLEHVLVEEKTRENKNHPEQQMLTLATTDLDVVRRLDVKAPQGKFPNYEKALWKPQRIHDRMNLSKLKKKQDTKLAATICVNAKLLKAVLDVVAQIHGGKEMVPVVLEVPLDPLTPIRFSCQGEEGDNIKMEGLIMPARDDKWEAKYAKVKAPVYPYEEETKLDVDETKEPLGETEGDVDEPEAA